jgi:DNA-binding CsgD family transcriptional regulator
VNESRNVNESRTVSGSSLKEIYLREAARIAEERERSSSLLLTTRISKPSCGKLGKISESGAIKSVPDVFSELTPREEDILMSIIRGKSNRLIGQDFGISENTVRNHVAKIMKKIKVNNRTEAAFLYYKKIAEKINEYEDDKPKEKTLLQKIIEEEKSSMGKKKIRKRIKEAARSRPPEILHPLEVRYGFLSKSSLEEN